MYWILDARCWILVEDPGFKWGYWVFVIGTLKMRLTLNQING